MNKSQNSGARRLYNGYDVKMAATVYMAADTGAVGCNHGIDADPIVNSARVSACRRPMAEEMTRMLRKWLRKLLGEL